MQFKLPSLRITPLEREVSRAHHAPLARQYGTLRALYKDPDAFFSEMSQRFESQRAKTPKDPYQFEFGDYGIPVLKQIDEAISAEMKKLAPASGRGPVGHQGVS